MLRNALLLLMISLCTFLPLSAQTTQTTQPSARLNTSLEPKADAYVGQRVTLVVELLSPTFFSGSPSFDLPKIPGVLLLPPIDHPVQGTTRVNGISYTTQRHELSIFAQRAGKIDIPPFTVTFDIASSTPGGPPASLTLTTTPLVYQATLPQGAEKLSTLIATTNLTVTDTWSPAAPENLKPGDALTHTITLTAADVPGMAFPPLPNAPIQGLGIYPKPPFVNDESSRGTLTGHLTQTITYICQSPGSFTIPACTLAWWDLDDKQLKTARITGQSFTVPAPPQAASQPASTSQTPNSAPIPPSHSLWLIAAAILLALIATVRLKPAFQHQCALRLARYNASEPGLFDAFTHAARHAAPLAAYQALLAWWQAAAPSPQINITQFARSAGHEDLAQTLDRLDNALFALTPDDPEARRLLTQLPSQLQSLRPQSSPRLPHNSSDLAPLNP